jgi:CRP-like cAMP-binding protein
MGETGSYFDLFREDESPARHKTGDVIFKIGDSGGPMYVVNAGTVALRVGRELLETVEPGGIFGEMALLDNEPRSATAVAVTDCELAVIDRERFEGALRMVPAFGTEVLRVMARRLRRRTELTSQA